MHLRRDAEDPIERSFSSRIWSTCTVKILVVTDEGIAGGFGPYEGLQLGQVLRLLRATAPPHLRYEFTTAHRQDELSATLPKFRFTQIDLSAFSQIWLFGILGNEQALDGAERDALARFMEQGGGVFATGDHENLGHAMTRDLPRVRSMRLWHWPEAPAGERVAPAKNGTERHNTIADPKPSTAINEGREDDGLPQTIRPRLYARTIPSGVFTRVVTQPHPVLCGPDGPIRYLPDHMHEGSCVVPSDLGRTFVLDGADRDEYPKAADGRRPAPEIIAWAASTETTATEFGVLCAYDGAPASVGRVLVDATWHHWFNENVLPLIAASTPGHPRYDPATVAKWQAIQAYYRNVPVWLADPATRAAIQAATWRNLLAYLPIYISTRNPESRDRLGYFWQLGTFAREALSKLVSRCEAVSLVTDTVDWLGLEMTPRSAGERATPAPAWLDQPTFETIALGGAVHQIAVQKDPVPASLTSDAVLAVHGHARRGAAVAAAEYFDQYVTSASEAQTLADKAHVFLNS